VGQKEFCIQPGISNPWRVELVVEPGSIGYAELSRLLGVTREEFDRAEAAARQPAGGLYRDRVAHFRAALAAARSYRRISTEMVRTVQPDFWAAYYEIVDTASHLFAADRVRGDRAVAAAYAEVDAALAETVRALDPRTLVLVVSDHGFQPADAGIRRDYGTGRICRTSGQCGP